MSADRIPWRCPGCGFTYQVSPLAHPALCPGCGNGHSPKPKNGGTDLSVISTDELLAAAAAHFKWKPGEAPPRATAIAPVDGEADPFPNIPAALPFRARRRAEIRRRRKRKLLREQLHEARRTLELLRDSDRVRSWQEDVRRAQDRVREAWTAWKEAEDERFRELMEKTAEVAALGVPKR